METREQILSRDFSNAFVSYFKEEETFIEKMKNSIEMSHYKYGWMSKTYPELAQGINCLKQRFELYEKTHNTELMIDVANFAMIEYLYPTYIPDTLKLELNKNFISNVYAIQFCIDKYELIPNPVYLISIAKYAAKEFNHPTYEDAKYEPSDSSKSPGLADGISYKELMENNQ